MTPRCGSDHFRRTNSQLARLLDEGLVSTHPFVVGELACGFFARRSEVLQLMAALPRAAMATPDEVIAFVDHQRLHGTGLGWIDVHLLASARLTRQALWSVDKRLRAAALRLGLAEPD